MLFDRDDPEQALAAFGDAKVLFDATGRDTEALRCDVRRAVVLRHMGDYQAAARLDERLVHEYSRLPDQKVAARWSVVRWLDDLREDQRFDACLALAEEHMGLWPEGSTTDDASYREFLGLYALVLESTDRVEQATAIATHVIANTPAREASIGTAYCYEIRGRSRLEQDEAAAGQDFSHAIALHLAQGNVARAANLSQYFLPVDIPPDDRAGSAEERVGQGSGHG